MIDFTPNKRVSHPERGVGRVTHRTPEKVYILFTGEKIPQMFGTTDPLLAEFSDAVLIMKKLKDYDPLTCTGPLCVAFRQCHDANPHIYEKLKELAFQVLAAGVKKYSMEGLYQRLRWHYDFEVKKTPGSWDVKLSDHHRARYSRLLMQQEPELAGFFDTVSTAPDC